MINQSSKNPLKRKRSEKKEEKRISKLMREGRLVDGIEIPPNVLAADPSKQNKGSIFATKYFYKDIQYKCRGCRMDFVWTAEQQKKYFEKEKGDIYNEPTWCYDCHRKRINEKYGNQ